MSPIRDDDRPKSGNWKWWVLGCVGGPLILIAGCFALAGGAFLWVRNAAPNRMALERAKHNPAVVEALGVPLKAGFSGDTQIQSGVSTSEGKSTRAVMTIPVTGPKGHGVLSVVAERRKGVWRYRRLEITVDRTGQRIDLRSPGEISDSSSGEPLPETPKL